MNDAASCPIRLLLICEGNSDEPIAKLLAQHVLCRAVDWLVPNSFEHPDVWVASPDGQPERFWRHENLDRLPAKRSIVKKFQAERLEIDVETHEYARARQALTKVAESGLADAVVVTRDGDLVADQRRAGWRAAIGKVGPKLRVAIGVADQCGEAWLLAAFRPSQEDQPTLAQWRQQLGFAPITNPHQLSHKEAHPRSAKRVLAKLVGEDTAQRAERCLGDAECLQRLCENGREAGAAEFLNELHALRTAFGETGPSDPPCVAAV